jgi:hypothetical protein
MYGTCLPLSGFGALFLFHPSLGLKRKCLLHFAKRENWRTFVNFHENSLNCNIAKNYDKKNSSANLPFREYFPGNLLKFRALQIFSQKVMFV